VCEVIEPSSIEHNLIDPNVGPAFPGLLRHGPAPFLDCGIFGGGTFPNSAFGLDDPVYLTFLGLLDDNPVRVIETNGATRF
jgi:hypothetical protein